MNPIDYNVDPITGCWNWLRYKTADGYGRLWGEPNRGILAHRLSYQQSKGPIPRGMEVCHSCDNPVCVNPTHLWLGTMQDNRQDCVTKRRHNFGLRNGSVKLTPRQISICEKANRLGVSQRFLASCFGVAHCTIGAALRRDTWKHLRRDT